MMPPKPALAVVIVAILVASLFAAVSAPAQFDGVGSAVKTHSPERGPMPTPLPAGSSAVPLVSPPSGSHIHPDISSYVIIRPDGSISSLTAPISIFQNEYNLTAAFAGAIVDERNDSTFNGFNHLITSTPSLAFGFQLNTTQNVTVSGVNVTDGADGIDVVNSSDVAVDSSHVVTAAATGVSVTYSSNVSLSDDNATGADVAFSIGTSDVVTLSDDIGHGGATGFQVSYSDAIDVFYSTATGLVHGFVASGAQDVWVADDNFSADTEVGLEFVATSYSTVEGTTATGCGIALEFVDDSGVDLDDSVLTMAAHDGAEILATDDLTIDDTNFSHSGSVGLFLDDGGYDDLTDVTSVGSAITGIDLENLTTVSLEYANASENGYNGLKIVDSQSVQTYGDTFNAVVHSAVGNGTWLRETSDVTLTADTDDYDYFGVVDIGSQGLFVMGSTASNDGFVGFAFTSDDSPTIEESTANNDIYGIAFSSSLDFDAYDDQTTGGVTGFYIEETVDGFLSDITVSDSLVGISVTSDVGSYFDSISVNDSSDGIVAEGDTSTFFYDLSITNASDLGAFLYESTSIALEDSNISWSGTGFELEGANFANVSGNTFFDDTNDFLITAQGMTGATVYWNNFIDGGGWGFDSSGGTPLAVVFDAGYPGGGNYWSNFTGPDVESGPGQNISGSDGIVDVPLPIGGIYEDHYPLTRPIDVQNLTVVFREVGLPSGSRWGVQLSGFQYGENSTYESVDFYTGAAAWQLYTYSVYAPAGWKATPGSGTFTTNSSSHSFTLNFTPYTYNATFTETGLAPGAKWNVTVDGKNYTGAASSITIALANGTYNYSVAAIDGYVVSPAKGSVSVDQNAPSVSLAFAAVLYAVTFTEYGLASGTTWNITIDGTPLTSTGTTITFHLANGTYTYQAGTVSGYTLVPSSGTQQVSGPGSNIAVSYTATTSSSSPVSSNDLLWLLLGVVVILVVVIALLLLRGRPKAAVAPAPGWSPPAGAAPPAPPPPPPAPGTPSPGATVPPPPSWQEG
jgi:Periplasmic copper-binding protein (NosD)/Right handed beta helix region